MQKTHFPLQLAERSAIVYAKQQRRTYCHQRCGSQQLPTRPPTVFSC